VRIPPEYAQGRRWAFFSSLLGLDGPIPSFFEHFSVDIESFVDCGHACIGGKLKKDFSQLTRITTYIQSSMDVKFQFPSGAKGSEHSAGSHLPFR